jgi:methyl-accepting chemotaxis protein
VRRTAPGWVTRPGERLRVPTTSGGFGLVASVAGMTTPASPPRLPLRPAAGAPRAAPAPHRIRFGILARTTVTMLAVGLVPLGLFGGIALLQQARQLRGDAERSLQASGERITAQVDEWFDKNVRVLRAAADLPALASMSADEQTRALTAIQRAYPWMYLVFTIGRDGKNVARSDGKALTDYSDRQYYKDVVAAGKTLSWETLIGKTSGKPAVILAVPIVASGAVVGVLAAAMTVEDVSAIIAHWKTGRTGFAFLVDDQAKVVAHPREEYVLGQMHLDSHALVAAFRQDGRPHTLAFTESDGKDELGYVQGNRFRWAIAIQQEKEELYAPLTQTLTLGLALLLAAALLAALTARVASRHLVRPILEMSRAADRMSTGQLDEAIPVSGVDELGVLARSLERLRISMRAAMARLG